MAEECPLTAPLTLKDSQSGIAGETGTVWTIAPDCSFTHRPPHRAKGSRAL